MSHRNILSNKYTALVIVDFQEAFRKMIPDFDRIAQSISNAARGFEILELPVIVTEQYPKGLGRTAPEVLKVLPDSAEIVEKTAFSSCGADEFLGKLKNLDVNQVLLCGLETHICVSQTAHDLLSQDFQVHLLQDCVGSRTDLNKTTGLEKMKMSGAIPSSVEMALFELMGDSKHEHFKAIQKLIK